MNVSFDTFGCRLNKAEALQMEADFIAKGWTVVTEHKKANLFVIRGCSVTERAQRECERLIDHLRRHYPSTPIRTCGCFSDKRQKTRIALTNYRQPLPTTDGAAMPVRTARAYLKVQDGCNGQCTFCIVPQFRGAAKSVPFTEALDKARRFIELGYHEIVVTGCNLALYASEGKRLPDLLAALAGLTASDARDRCRIRIGSLEPWLCADETIEAMAENANICRFLHIPIQSGSARVLSAMNRPYKVEEIHALVEKATARIPNLGLGCDMMTGFPGETELDFAATQSLLERYPFTNIHVFPYSERPGTAAIRLRTSVPSHTRSSRAHALSKLMKAGRRRFAHSFVGKTVEIVVESDDKIVGWTDEYLRCKALVGSAKRKSFARILVNQCRDDTLYGKLLPDR